MKTDPAGPPDSSTVVTLRLRDETKSKLTALARQTRRTRSFLADEAIADYVEREMALIDAIREGLADVEAGRVTPHDEAMRQIRATIAQAHKGL